MCSHTHKPEGYTMHRHSAHHVPQFPLLLDHNTEAYVKDSLPRHIAQTVAGGGLVWTVKERAAPHHLHGFCVHGVALGRLVRIAHIITARPLGNIAVHIINTPCVGLILFGSGNKELLIIEPGNSRDIVMNRVTNQVASEGRIHAADSKLRN